MNSGAGQVAAWHRAIVELLDAKEARELFGSIPGLFATHLFGSTFVVKSRNPEALLRLRGSRCVVGFFEDALMAPPAARAE